MLRHDDIIEGRIRSGESALRRARHAVDTAIVAAVRRVADGDYAGEYSLDLTVTGPGGRQSLVQGAFSARPFRPGTAVVYEARRGDLTDGVFVVGPVFPPRPQVLSLDVSGAQYTSSQGGLATIFSIDIARVTLNQGAPVLAVDLPQATLTFPPQPVRLLSMGGRITSSDSQIHHTHDVEGGSGTRVLDLSLGLGVSAPAPANFLVSRKLLIHQQPDLGFVGVIPPISRILNLAALWQDPEPDDTAVIRLFSGAALNPGFGNLGVPTIDFGSPVYIHELSDTAALLEAL